MSALVSSAAERFQTDMLQRDRAMHVVGNFKGVGQLEAKFWVEGLRFAPIFTDR